MLSRLIIAGLLCLPLYGNAVPAVKTAQPAKLEAKQAVKNININTASLAQLKTVAGMSDSKAKGIVSYREKNGGFKNLEELKSVKGFKRIKAEKLSAITAQLSVS